MLVFVAGLDEVALAVVENAPLAPIRLTWQLDHAQEGHLVSADDTTQIRMAGYHENSKPRNS